MTIWNCHVVSVKLLTMTWNKRDCHSRVVPSEWRVFGVTHLPVTLRNAVTWGSISEAKWDHHVVDSPLLMMTIVWEIATLELCPASQWRVIKHQSPWGRTKSWREGLMKIIKDSRSHFTPSELYKSSNSMTRMSNRGRGFGVWDCHIDCWLPRNDW